MPPLPTTPISPKRMFELQAQRRLAAGFDWEAEARRLEADRQAKIEKAYRDGRSVAAEQMSYEGMRQVIAAGTALNGSSPGVTWGGRDALKGLRMAGRAAFIAGVASVLAEIDGAPA